jgi:hypothetical protein
MSKGSDQGKGKGKVHDNLIAKRRPREKQGEGQGEEQGE